MAFGMWYVASGICIYIICMGLMELFCGGRFLGCLYGMRIEVNEIASLTFYNICHLLYMKILATVEEP